MWKKDVGRFVIACLVVAAVVLVGNTLWRRQGRDAGSPDTESGPDYSHVPATWAGRDACRECHAAADSLWTGSDHDLAMQLPGPGTITADFDSASYTHFGVTSTFTRRGERYFVRTDGPDGALADFEIAYVFGYFPLEQFLIRFADGRLQALNVCWDSRPAAEGGQRWFHLYPDDPTPARDMFHWTRVLQNWNYMCAECHSTNLERNYDVATDRYATSWSEIDVSCESCHGPGTRHVTWERAAARGLRPRNEDGMRGLVVDLASPDTGTWIFAEGEPTAERSEPLASDIEVEACARCHARRSPLTTDYAYGRPLLDHYRLVLLEENLYHADGQNQDEVYVYGSFLQSKMHASGVTCSDCHDYHTTRTIGTGNQVCARCHRAEVFDTPDHHFHQPGKGGDSCLDCHQQARHVMVVDARRDHSFRVPRPELSLALGTPNACSDCHTDKTVQWAQDAVVKWYGAARKQGPHFAQALHAGRTGEPAAAARLWALVGAEDQPGIARATALSLLPRYGPTADRPELAKALADPDPLVRAEAVRSVATSAPSRRRDHALPLVEDEVRAVRLAAARIIALLPPGAAAGGSPRLAAAAHEQWETYLAVNRERSETWLELAAYRLVQGRSPEAEDAFRRAIALAPAFGPAYVNFADHLRLSGRPQAAAAVLRDGIATATEPAELHHALGLHLSRAGKSAEALAELERAAQMRPQVARFGYVLGVALHDAGRTDAALDALARVLADHPWDPDTLHAMALYALESAAPRRGLPAAENLAALFPGDSQVAALRARLAAAVGP